jgi:hypothetical protein|tara:strand:- start:6160 stop:6309 length:150 start_codon:yes stop_codon:yes gene_type:complete
MSDKTTYLIKDIDREKWKTFRGRCLIHGYNSAGECLRDFIYDTVESKSK